MKYVIATALILLLAIGVMVIGPRWAQAQTMYPPGCDKTDTILKILSGIKQSPIGMGISDAGELVSVFADKDGSFTIVVSTPNHVSCIRSGGTDWMSQKMKPEGRAS